MLRQRIPLSQTRGVSQKQESNSCGTPFISNSSSYIITQLRVARDGVSRHVVAQVVPRPRTWYLPKQTGPNKQGLLEIRITKLAASLWNCMERRVC